ncbi:MAG TPA: PAS domain-containing sensor histidine kinase [Pontibacter sp.]
MDERTNYDILMKLIDQTSMILFSYDVDSKTITFLNNAFARNLRLPVEQVVANPGVLLEWVHPDDRAYLQEEYRELLAGNGRYRLEFRLVLPDQTEKWLLLQPLLVTRGNGSRFVTGFVEDITALKDNIRTLQKFAAKKNSILEILSHDLAGPLANIGALAELLSDYTREYENEELDKVIRLIRESSERNVRMIREFVQQEFLESANSELFKQRVDLVEKMIEVVEQYKSSEERIQKEFRFTYSSGKVYVHIDQNKFMQVINNLVSNAIKFTPDNGIITIDLLEQKDTVLITVKDNGIGIPKHYHDQLFEKFTKARREGLRGEPSTGLGMSIIKTIVEWHHGRIWFESEEQVGTTFYIEIPKE